MNDSSGYLRLRPIATTAVVAGLMAVSTLGVLANGGAFEGGDKVGKDDGSGAVHWINTWRSEHV